MRVIFIKDLKNQGRKGDIKEVKDGYATNFLIKNGYAVKETKESLKKLNEEKQKKQQIDQEKRKEALKLKKQLESQKYKFVVRTGKEDKVFGSISTKQIKEKLMTIHDIDKKQIILDAPIQTLGFHEVEIELYKDIKAKIKIEVTK